MHVKKYRFLLFLFLFFLSNGVVQADLVNPGFETGDSTGWTVSVFGGATTGVGLDNSAIPGESAVVNVRSGDYAAWGTIADRLGRYVAFSQDVNVAAGEYNIGFFAGTTRSSFGIDAAITNGNLAIFVNGVNIGFDVRYPHNSIPIGTTPADMYEFSKVTTLTAGTHTVEFRISGSGTAIHDMSFDDAFITLVPSSSYTVGGTVSGLTGSVTLQNNDGDDIIKTTNDGFTFPSQAEGTDYAVTVSSQPSGQTCSITGGGNNDGSGTNITANITDIAVGCVDDAPPSGPATPIPTMSVWGLGILIALMSLVGFNRRRKI
jgi:hypothetical protein